PADVGLAGFGRNPSRKRERRLTLTVAHASGSDRARRPAEQAQRHREDGGNNEGATASANGAEHESLTAGVTAGRIPNVPVSNAARQGYHPGWNPTGF